MNSNFNGQLTRRGLVKIGNGKQRLQGQLFYNAQLRLNNVVNGFNYLQTERKTNMRMKETDRTIKVSYIECI